MAFEHACNTRFDEGFNIRCIVQGVDARHERNDKIRRASSLVTLGTQVWFHPSPTSRIHPPGSTIGDQDKEYELWGRLDDPDSVRITLHVERPKLGERKRFSSYREYKTTRNQPMKDNDEVFKKNA